jgi:hypothetical protein
MFFFLLIYSWTLLGNTQTQTLEQLAQIYAPTIYQGIGSIPEADEFTKVNFDGDWDPHNNWDNLLKFNRPRVVYWSIIESEQHYFITYAFFYPRDYSAVCFFMHCHENDFEGMRITVKKPSKILKLEALAHNFKSEVVGPNSLEVVIESGGHGVYPAQLKSKESKFVRLGPQDYDLLSMDELIHRRDSNLFEGSFFYKGQSFPAHFGGKKWILFGLGRAKPAWSWEVWNSSFQKGEWFLDPLKNSKENYLFHPLGLKN